MSLSHSPLYRPLPSRSPSSPRAASIFTVYEIRTSGEWAGNEFCALEPVVLVRALEALEREGAATLVRDESTPADEVGVKFRERR